MNSVLGPSSVGAIAVSPKLAFDVKVMSVMGAMGLGGGGGGDGGGGSNFGLRQRRPEVAVAPSCCWQKLQPAQSQLFRLQCWLVCWPLHHLKQRPNFDGSSQHCFSWSSGRVSISFPSPRSGAAMTTGGGEGGVGGWQKSHREHSHFLQ